MSAGHETDGCMRVRTMTSLFRIIDADTGEEVGTPIRDVDKLWPSIDGTRLHAVMDGRSDPGPRSADR